MSRRPSTRAGWRDWARAARAALSGEQREAASVTIAEALRPHLAGARVGLFVPVGDECAACARWYDAGCDARAVGWPRTMPGGVMRFYASPIWPSSAGRYGIPEPDAREDRALDARDLDVVVVPGLCFDVRGHRLGYGAGYYDRFLSTLRADTLRVGVAFEAQVIDHVPNEAHDERVDLLLTERRARVFDRARDQENTWTS